MVRDNVEKRSDVLTVFIFVKKSGCPLYNSFLRRGLSKRASCTNISRKHSKKQNAKDLK